MIPPAPGHAPDDLAVVRDPLAPARVVAAAARRLVGVPASIWTGVANDPAYPLVHRRLCVFELMRRHVQSGMTAAQVAALLGRPAWLADADLRDLGDIGGRPVPLSLPPGDTVTVIDVLPDPDPTATPWAVYLRWHGVVERAALSALLRDPAASNAAGPAVLAEIAFLPTVAEIDNLVQGR
jgi:hypothetical protein